MAYLELNNINKYFGKTAAVENFNLQVERGELVSFLGPSGCGKTTTLRMVAGFETPTQGRVIINNEDVTHKSPNQRDVGMIFQSYALFPNLTVAGNIGFGLKIAKKPAEEIHKRVQDMLDLIHMPDYGNRYPYQLSGGQQQRVALARALALSPDVLLLDEPLSALDAKIRVSLRSEIRAIQQELGITAIYVTHDQEEALSISDRIVVMYNGHIEQIGSPFQIYNFPETAFVASFIGTLNSFNAEVTDLTNNVLRVGDLRLTTAENLEDRKVGDKVMIAIRPERLNFSSDLKKANLIDCTIENITFLGSIVRIQVKVGDLRLHMDTFNNPFLELPKIGDKAEITCSREAVIILQH
ncbi:MAG: spermidine/putrescine ABC transporter ATP-binding protein [Chloroflexi bacterium GWB2_49_20]|nr:MAG: spermidine/putrescine ABC transporter ATP-binding protein [Chloroflexi bacterium GWB2_49_20]OGN76752.1 MAG: spermidine/putrescine ABC transporter ATP-binding protein [Chloroflexi bacterium GWC2_49_37]OGN83712.1 MAG: spermidine/putrescine ABC transporter ATP-binding protein [Chloroflexi bacterium GWD2_49_16]HBG74165.1 spermidine/putrescine ABC transporter ATP-binding protein [Anaerolineae bacterium]HCC79017.1 spermidine/putrescine ABC transporter ATP-binding protein [Anaerolineae bacteri